MKIGTFICKHFGTCYSMSLTIKPKENNEG